MFTQQFQIYIYSKLQKNTTLIKSDKNRKKSVIQSVVESCTAGERSTSFDEDFRFRWKKQKFKNFLEQQYLKEYFQSWGPEHPMRRINKNEIEGAELQIATSTS